VTLPAPLTPPDSDLQDFPFMPLQVARLRDSDLAAEEHPEACWYAVLLWSAAWHQLPAGSLPDNDAVLTKLIGLGRDVKTFAKHRAGALRGFIKCSDGRLYHPIVAEQVLASWEGKLRQRWRTECGRIKKANQRNKADDPHGYVEMPSPSFEDFVASSYVPPMSPPKTANVPGDKADCPSGHGVQGIETGTGTGTPKIDIGTSSLLSDQGPTEVAANDHSKPSTALTLIGEPPPPAKRGKAKAEPIAAEREHFDAFWSVYPRREGKQPALLAFVATIRSGVDPNRIVAGAQRYAAVRQGQDPKLTKMAQGWLNDRRWEDEIAEPPPSGYRDQRGGRDAWDPIQQAIDGMDFDRDDAA